MSKILAAIFAAILALSTASVLKAQTINGVPNQVTSLQPGEPTYTFYVSGGTVYARSEATKSVAYSGTDAAAVINSALSTMSTTGGTLYFKNGTYNINSCSLETVSPYTTICYAIGIPAGTGTNFPNFNFVGESGAIGSQANPAASGVIFNVTAAALTAAGANTLAAFWAKPNTTCNASYQTLTGSCLYWNGHDSFKDLAINFPNNTRGNEYAIDVIESSYLHLQHVQAGFLTAPTALGAANLTAFKTPATPSDGVLIEETQGGPGWDIDYEINTEHAILINTEAFMGSSCYVYASQLSRNSGATYHSSQFIHPQVYDCVRGVLVGTHAVNGAQLDIIGLDQQYATTGTWTMSYTFSPANVGGLLTWTDISDAGVVGALTSPFMAGSTPFYTVVKNGNLSMPTLIGTGGTPTVTYVTGAGAQPSTGSTNLIGSFQVSSSGALDFKLNWVTPTGAAYSYPGNSNCSFNVAASNSDVVKEIFGGPAYVEGWGSTAAANEYVTYICAGR